MSTLAERAAIHAALGESLRLEIVEALVDSDRSVGELAHRSSIPSNLLAHHLDVLERAGVIERVVSSGDRRRRYVKLRAESIAVMALAPASAPPARVLFVCTHNSARSQLAAAVWHREFGGRVRSAGTDPARRVHPGAIAAAKKVALDLSHNTPRALTSADLAVDLVVTVCDRAHEELSSTVTWRHWSIPDPIEAGHRGAFDEALDLIDAHVRLARPAAA